MKIYFAGSIRGGRDDRELYGKIIDHLRSHGAVLSEHIGSKEVSSLGEHNLSDEEIFRRDLELISQADLVVAEITNPSFGVAYEVVTALMQGKKLLCLYREQEGKRLSAMISGNPAIPVKRYKTEAELFEILDHYFTAQ